LDHYVKITQVFTSHIDRPATANFTYLLTKRTRTVTAVDKLLKDTQLHNVTYTVRHKNAPIFYHNLKKGYPILIIFGTDIHDTTGHQMAV